MCRYRGAGHSKLIQTVARAGGRAWAARRELVARGVAAMGTALLWLAGPHPAQTHGSSRWARPAEWRTLGRRCRPDRCSGDGIVLGWLGRFLLETPREDNLLLLGVQRSGKTSSIIVPTLLGWSGAVLATSTKEELVQLTARQRARRGPVHVFAPLDRDSDWIRALGLSAARWNPLAGTLDVAAAAELASHFTHPGRGRSPDHWYLAAASLMTALMAMESRRGADLRAVLSRLNSLRPDQYIALAATCGHPAIAELLAAHGNTPEREAGSVASTARSCLSLWIDDRIAAATGPGPNQLDLDQLLAEGGSLYLVAPAEEAERCRPLFSALLMRLLRCATMRARQQHGSLSPRLLLALDEAANFARIPRLAGYASTGPGQGIQLLLGFHDLAQIEHVYGREEARTIWNNCRARILLPGQGDLITLDHFSRAMGEQTRVYSVGRGDRLRPARSEQRLARPLCSIDELRRSKRAVLLYAGAHPAQMVLRRWDQVADWRSLVESGPPIDPAPDRPTTSQEVFEWN
ncbi:MAG TPA: type IV secretory system conjugative DNA transfer family protein [Candidatus Acidoferrales bacterium]|nr:type IV secretory system conjugative DNA transfer family protein [Candidatus Acidoferrales bacterium]